MSKKHLTVSVIVLMVTTTVTVAASLEPAQQVAAAQTVHLFRMAFIAVS